MAFPTVGVDRLREAEEEYLLRAEVTAMPTMFEKIWNRHVVAEGPGGQTLLYIDRHLLHEGGTAALTRLRRAGARCVGPKDWSRRPITTCPRARDRRR